jgi:hypothetical protein
VSETGEWSALSRNLAQTYYMDGRSYQRNADVTLVGEAVSEIAYLVSRGRFDDLSAGETASRIVEHLAAKIREEK